MITEDSVLTDLDVISGWLY